MSLRTWLLGLSLLATLPLLAFALSVVWDYKNFQQQTLIEQLERRSDDMAHAVSEELENTVGTLTSLAVSDAALALDIPTLYHHAQRVVGHQSGIRAITLVDAERILFLTSVPLERTGLPLGAPELVAEALRTQSPNASGPFISPISPLQVVAVTVPIVRSNGTATHALRGIIAANALNQFVAADQLPAGWIAGIADRNGILVARSHDADRYVGKPSSASFREAILSGQSQATAGATLEGTLTINRVRPIFGLDWYLGMAVPQSILNASVHDMLKHIAGLATLWMALSVLAAVVFSAYLVRQMQSVADAMAHDEATLPERRNIHIQELVEVFQRFRSARQREVAVRGDLHLAEAARAEVQDLYDHAPCGYHSLDPEGRVVRMNQTELSWLGRSLDEVLGRHFQDFLTPASQAVFRQRYSEFMCDGYIKDLELELIRGSGTPMPILISASALRDEQGRFLASRTTVFDHTEQKMVEAQLEQLAHTDMLTALPNRRAFYERAQTEIARSRRMEQGFSVLMLDVDHFKKINDHFGHAGGDAVLRQLGRQLVSALREVDLPARLGGEEFAVIVPGTPLSGAHKVAERIREMLQATPVLLDDGPQIAFTVSMGVAQWQRSDADIDATLHRADEALYQAKSGGRNRVCVSPAPTTNPTP
ncbi:sensor domain-containing diguanylate cyclase [Macromonas nakdongensis]|uniref:sensor domain-containing diguanylate cyclase n=1 Tax=Macromonas nakdongensis TaxID=1843082 RepID=UPI0012FF5211|nr:diguanylate cyclase [Macromonas nakdongensis]